MNTQQRRLAVQHPSIAVAVLALFLPLSAAAQPTSPASDTEAVTADAPPLPATTALVVQALRESNPTTPAELLEAIRILIPFEQYDLAKDYLAQFQQLSPDATALADLQQRFGSAYFVKLASNSGLAPEGREVAMNILRAANQKRRDPKRLARLINQLDDPAASVRRMAGLDLAEAQEAAVAPLLDALRDTHGGASRQRYREALVRLGPRAEAPLLAVLSAPDMPLQSDAVYALGYVGSSVTVPYLIRPYFAPDEQLARAAGAAFQRLARAAPVSIPDGTTLLRRRAKYHFAGQPPQRADIDGLVTLWTWDAEIENVVPNRLHARDAASIAAARLARDWYYLQPDDGEAIRLFVASRLRVDQRLGGMDQPLRKGQGTAYAMSVSAGPQVVTDVLAQALQDGHHAIAIAAAEVLGDIGDEGMLHGNGRFSPLAKALRSPNRRVRFAAAQAVMKIDPRRQFPGASFHAETLADLAAVSDQRTVVIGHPRVDRGSMLSGQLSELGFATQQATTGNRFLQTSFVAPAVDFLLVSDTIDCPPASEVLQQLRQDSRTSELPVGLLSQPGRDDEAASLADRDSLVVAFPANADGQTLLANVQKLLQLNSRDYVPLARRIEQADLALDWLIHLARYSETYPWYDVARHQAAVEQALNVPVLARKAITLLGYIGTETAQASLLSVARQGTSRLQYRQLSADAFTEAVLRRGLMLSNADIRNQLASRRQDDSNAATQAIDSQLRDTIETQLQDRDARAPAPSR